MKFIILSQKHMTDSSPVFWRANDAGYTNNPFAAGIYTAEQIKESPDYYNDGHSSIAIPLTTQALEEIGFSCSVNIKALDGFLQTSKEIARGVKRTHTSTAKQDA